MKAPIYKLPNNYQYFGNDLLIHNLELFIKTNPFYSFGLKHIINNETSKNEFILDTTDVNTWLGKLVDCMDVSYPRFSVKFDENLKVIGFYDSLGKEIELNDPLFDKKMGQFTFMITYVVEVS